VLANDTDPDGPPPSVATVDGQAIAVGQTITILSGAKVTRNANGTLTYDPNHKFDTLTSTDSGETGAANTSASDSFTYGLVGGVTASVSVTVNGLASAQDHLNGDLNDNVITGTGNADYFDLSQGGNDTASGLGGDDAFFFGAAFTSGDQVDGGPGTNDQIGLQGNYSGPNALVMGANTIANIEAIVLLGNFSYQITTDDGNVAAGGVLKVQATQLTAGNSLVFNGAAETDGSFLVFGSNGNDALTGGQGNDGFYVGPGQFTGADIVNGGAGTNDQLGLDGDYTITLASNVTNVEVLALLSGPAGTPNHFDITSGDAFAGAGQTRTVFGVQVTTAITFNGAGEHDGAFKIYGGSGNDNFTGSDGSDWIFGGYGADTMTGGAGRDTFFYDDAAQSTGTGFDRITGFDDNSDMIDVPFTVSGFATPASGNLSNASFNTDLSAAFVGLTSHQGGMFTATGGDMAGRTFLVIDADGAQGYQAGSDYVIEMVTPASPVDNPAIFI
jgi:Ca2+-binding RTX toxin-like protein